MDIHSRVSGPGVFIGSRILSGSLLSVRRKNVLANKASELNGSAFFGYVHYSYLNSNFAFNIHLVAHDSASSLCSLSTPNHRYYVNCPIQTL
jgi:hypothetical protein